MHRPSDNDGPSWEETGEFPGSNESAANKHVQQNNAKHGQRVLKTKSCRDSGVNLGLILFFAL